MGSLPAGTARTLLTSCQDLRVLNPCPATLPEGGSWGPAELMCCPSQLCGPGVGSPSELEAAGPPALGSWPGDLAVPPSTALPWAPVPGATRCHSLSPSPPGMLRVGCGPGGCWARGEHRVRLCPSLCMRSSSPSSPARLRCHHSQGCSARCPHPAKGHQSPTLGTKPTLSTPCLPQPLSYR